MFIDALLLLSDAQAFSATGFSTNTIDLALVTPQRDVAIGEQLGVMFTVDVAADAGTGDETYTFQLVQSANANLSSPDVIAQIAIARATLVAGYGFFLPIPWNQITKRFFGVQMTLAGTTPSITLTAFLQPASMASLPKPATYADAITIS
jgi:hypothetical protein